jgi:hypothetical protein
VSTQHMSGDNDTPVDPMETLKGDLFSLYYSAGRNVRYVADSGEDRAYWPNRFLQALRKAVEVGDAEVLAYARRMVMSDDPSRGFGYLDAADRLDITVEALVANPKKRYHHLFDGEMVDAAIARLAAHGYTVPGAGDALPKDTLSAAAIVETPDGFAVELTVEVARDGLVRMHAGDLSEPADGTLGAVRAFVHLLAQADAAARTAS